MHNPVFWVAVPFPCKEQAESMLCEVEELGYRAAVVEATPSMIQLYIDSAEA